MVHLLHCNIALCPRCVASLQSLIVPYKEEQCGAGIMCLRLCK